MPLPAILIGTAAATGAAGLAKSSEAAIKFIKAKKLIKDAQHLFELKKNELEHQKDIASGILVNYGELKLKIWDEQFSEFVRLFSKIKNVNLEEQKLNNSELGQNISSVQLLEIKQLSVSAGQIVSGGVASIGVGAIAGVASYGGAMMFASASTGTAIASLTGVAASNATLAWFGGGSLATGGLGMSGGAVVLGGLIAGPVLAVGGLLMASKAKANLAEAKAKHMEALEATEIMESAIDMLSAIEDITKQYLDLVKYLRAELINALKELDDVVSGFGKNSNRSIITRIKYSLLGIIGNKMNVKYNELSIDEKHIVHKASQTIQLVKIVLEKPLLDDEGVLDSDTAKYILNTDFQSLLDGVDNE